MKTLTQAGQEYRVLLNAGLTLIDDQGETRPYLAENVPALNTDSWRLFPDGRMETRYRLRPGLTWHDGQPLSGDDFIFAWRVYSAPGVGIFSPQPQDQMEQLELSDDRTLIIRWRAPYPGAGMLTNDEFPPLPRHLLGQAFEAVEQDPAGRDAFLNHRYWNPDYVGVGAFRLESLEPGAGIEAAAFDGHALGRPRVDKISARLFADENTVLAGVLAGTIHIATGITLRFEHAQVLNGEWVLNKQGTVSWGPARLVGNVVQFRPEYLKTPSLLDARVRKALLYAVDRQGLNDGIFEGQSVVPETYVNPQLPFFPEIERAITRYPYDPRQTEEFLGQVGYSKDREGLFASASGERFRPDYQVLTGTQFERGGAIITDGLRRVGIDTAYSVLPAVQVRNNEVRNTFPGISTPGGGALSERGLAEFFHSRQIGTPANGWTGSNRGGWPIPEYDTLFDTFNTTLARTERTRVLGQMMKVLSDELPGWPLYLDMNVIAYVAGVRGPSAGIEGSSSLLWDSHLWELTP